jgi:hypothetical protein
MGRFYSGDIEGKFWFGVQCSDDVENLVTITGNTDYSWHVCNCVAEIKDDDYCRQCYESKEEHIEAAIEEGEYDDSCLYYEECSHGYSLDKETHYEELLANMENLKKEIPEGVIKFFENIEQNDKILDAFTGVFNDTNKHIVEKPEDDKERTKLFVLIARYTLGYQIEYCLRTTDSCNINCEY